MPSLVRPARPERWEAEARETGSIGSRCTFVLLENRLMRARPASITYRIPGTVSDVSAMFVDRMMRCSECGA